jgi:recombination protein RecA
MADNNNDDIFKKLVDSTAKAFGKKFKDSEAKFNYAKDEKPPTGLIVDNPMLEYILDRRFLAYGRFYLVYGQNGSCKTSLFYDLAKTFQRKGGKVIWLETENAIDLDYAKKQGVDLDNVLLIHPQSLEEALNLAETFIRNLSKIDPEGQMPILICLDSIAGSVTEYEQDSANDITNTTPGTHARLLSRFYREMEHPLANERCVFLALNQQKHKIGGFGFGEQISMMGGEAPMFSSTYQWKMSRTSDLKIKNEHGAERKYGSTHKVVCTRNKLGREGNSQEIEFDLYINGGIDWYSPLVRMVGKSYETLIEKSGARYRWLVPGMTYIDKDGEEKLIDTEQGYYDKDLGYIIANSAQAKEAIRNAFEIPPLPSEQEVAEVEKERLTKRKRKKDEEKEL